MRQPLRTYENSPFTGRDAFQEKLSELRRIIAKAVDLLASIEIESTPILVIDRVNGKISSDHGQASLSPSEMVILITLSGCEDLVTRDALLGALYPHRTSDGPSSLYVLLSSLRNKLKQVTQDCPIETVKGRGFRFRRDLVRPELAAPRARDPFTRSRTERVSR